MDEDEGGKAALWTFVGMILGFKVATSIIIFVMDPSIASATFLLAMQWYWLLIPLPFLAVSAAFWFRLWRVRRRRRQLIHAEWRVEPEADLESTLGSWHNVTPPG